MTQSGNPYPHLPAEVAGRLAQMVTSGLLPTLEWTARQLSAPFWWVIPGAEGREKLQAGTMCIVHTGARLIGITAGHIHRSATKHLLESTGSWCQMGGATFDPARQLIDCDDRVDLATYDLSEVQVAAARADVHRPVSWPPQASEREAVFICGWPWSLGTARATDAQFTFLHFLGKLDGVEDPLSAVIGTRESVAWTKDQLPEGTNLGGMSGGPVFSLREGTITHLELVGVVFEYSPTLEIVLARPLDRIDVSGRILR